MRLSTSAIPEARDRAGDRGTSKTGPSGREGGFEDGGLGASCFARGVATAATAPSTGTVGEVMPADADARAEEHGNNCTQAAGSHLRCVMVDGLELHSKAVPPKYLDPADHKRRAEDC